MPIMLGWVDVGVLLLGLGCGIMIGWKYRILGQKRFSVKGYGVLYKSVRVFTTSSPPIQDYW